MEELKESSIYCLTTTNIAISKFKVLRDIQINKHQFDLERHYIEAMCNLFLQQHNLEKTVSLGVMSSMDGFTDHEADGVTDRGASKSEQDETPSDGNELVEVMSSKEGVINPLSNQTLVLEGEYDQDKAAVDKKQHICKPAGRIDKGDERNKENEIQIEDTMTCFKDALAHYNYLNEIIGHEMVKDSCKQTKHEKKEMNNLYKLIDGFHELLLEQNVNE